MTACRRYFVRGRVQGVGYRYFVQKEGIRLGLRGWVRNLDDGRVEALAEGSTAALADFEGSLHRGPRWADVRGVEIQEAPAEAPPGFSIL